MLLIDIAIIVVRSMLHSAGDSDGSPRGSAQSFWDDSLCSLFTIVTFKGICATFSCGSGNHSSKQSFVCLSLDLRQVLANLALRTMRRNPDAGAETPSPPCHQFPHTFLVADDARTANFLQWLRAVHADEAAVYIYKCFINMEDPCSFPQCGLITSNVDHSMD